MWASTERARASSGCRAGHHGSVKLLFGQVDAIAGLDQLLGLLAQPLADPLLELPSQALAQGLLTDR